jgi:hypothetical protein
MLELLGECRTPATGVMRVTACRNRQRLSIDYPIPGRRQAIKVTLNDKRAADTGRAHPLHNLIAIGIERRITQVAVRVNPHDQTACGALRPGLAGAALMASWRTPGQRSSIIISTGPAM